MVDQDIMDLFDNSHLTSYAQPAPGNSSLNGDWGFNGGAVAKPSNITPSASAAPSSAPVDPFAAIDNLYKSDLASMTTSGNPYSSGPS